MQLQTISENSFICYLSAEDLSARQLTTDDLHYGNANARKLFTEIIERAKEELHFQRKDLPLMIEAVPMQDDELFLQITRIEEADELEPRFAQFAPSILDELDDEDELDFSLEDTGPEEAESVFSEQPRPQSAANTPPSAGNIQDVLFCFRNYDDLIGAVRILDRSVNARSALYYDLAGKRYYLVMERLRITPRLALLCEYASMEACTPLRRSYLREHLTCLIPVGALKRLRESLTPAEKIT